MALQFATKAADTFVHGTEKDRREVFATMRLNSTLRDKKLSIQKVYWLSAIEEHMPPLMQKMKALELEFRGDKPGFIAARAALDPLMRARVDAIGTEPVDLPRHPP